VKKSDDVLSCFDTFHGCDR